MHPCDVASIKQFYFSSQKEQPRVVSYSLDAPKDLLLNTNAVSRFSRYNLQTTFLLAFKCKEFIFFVKCLDVEMMVFIT